MNQKNLQAEWYTQKGELTSEGRNYAMLVDLRKELYGGSWKKMREDLEVRAKARPYIFKLYQRIKKDLKRIDNLEEAEKNNSDITDLLITSNHKHNRN